MNLDQQTQRPPLNRQTSAADFQDFYWLKEELVAFCRACGLPTSGAKIEIAQRISDFLITGQKPPKVRRVGGGAKTMPTTFKRTDTIQLGWRCSQALRAFFEAESGHRFHINKTMRDFIKQGAGRTLQEAIDAWQDDQESSNQTEIAPQFEYNRHMRAFRQQNPQASFSDAVQSWKELRSLRKSSTQRRKFSCG